MIAVFCKRVVRDTMGGGSEIGGNGRRSEIMFEDEDEDERVAVSGGVISKLCAWRGLTSRGNCRPFACGALHHQQRVPL